jgi:hypothetical protein
MTAVMAHLVLIDPPEADGVMKDLHDLLLSHPSIRDAFGLFAFAYVVKTGLDAGDLSALVSAIVPGEAILVTEMHPQRIAGRLSPRALEWLESPPPPARREGHQPDADALDRLPPIEAVEPSITEARIAALMGAKTRGAN